MDQVHRARITKNLVKLIDATNYDPLIASISRLDKEKVIPDVLMSKWKERRGFRMSSKQLNRLFFEEIQHRGPKAFQLLLSSLEDTRQKTVIEVLDPTLRAHESDEEENIPPPFYPDEGIHYMYIDTSWQSDACKHDRNAIKAFLTEQGYTEYLDGQDWVQLQEKSGKEVGSLIVVNFCSLSNGGAVRENEWIYTNFAHPKLTSKPKILLSFRYLKTPSAYRDVHTDTEIRRTFFKDIFQVRMFLDGSQKRPGEISDETKILLQVLSEENPDSFTEKMQRLQHELDRFDLHPLHTQDSDFSKQFKLKKSQ